MSKGRLRLGVLGAGAWTVASHLPNLVQRKEEVDLVSVCRRDPIQAEAIRARFGFDFATTDFREALDAGVDLCIVAGPVAVHHEHTKAALEAGAHVLCEKPFTIRSGEAWELVDLANRLERHLVLAYGWHYFPMVETARSWMRTLGVGQIEQASVNMSSTTREALRGTQLAFSDRQDSDSGDVDLSNTDPLFAPRPETGADPAVAGGGYAQAQLSHALGLLFWLTELRCAEVFAWMATPPDSRVEFHDALCLRFENDAIGTVSGGSNHLGSNQNKHKLDIRIIGSEGQFHIDLERELAWIYRPGELDEQLPVSPGDGAYNCDGPIHTLIDLALGRDVTNQSPGEVGARTVEVIEGAYRSAEVGLPVSVSSLF